jgi:Uma2 family endonuclease
MLRARWSHLSTRPTYDPTSFQQPPVHAIMFGIMASVIASSASQFAESAVAVAAVTAPAETGLTLWRCSVEKYRQMVRTGIIGPDDRVELLDGLIVEKMTKSPRHCLVARRLRDALERYIPKGWHVDSQDPVTLPTSEPEPDATVVRGEPEDYENHRPGPADVPLVAEVSDSSLSHDRKFKKSMYAAARIAVYWVVNLIDRCVEVYSSPSGSLSEPDYVATKVFGVEERVPLVLDGRTVAEIPVAEILR